MARSSGTAWRDLALPLASLGVAAAIVFHGALAQFFSQDDFGWMAGARGLIERPSGPWRFLSLRLFWDLMRPLGMNALAYHLVSLAVHVATTCLLFTFLRRRVSTPAAWLGSVFFVVHPALYAALYWASAIGDVLALLFALATLQAMESSGRRRWVAAPLFACSLMSKESTLLLPLWIALEFALGVRQSTSTDERRVDWRRALDPVVISLTLIAALHLASLVIQNISGIRSAGSEPSPYAMGFDRTLWLNLLTYLGWAVNFFYPTVTAVSDGVDPTAFIPGGAALLLWLAGLAWRPLRERGWVAAGTLFGVLLMPVLPLRNHTYHYYLYAPLVGAAWCLAALFDALFGRRRASASAISASSRRARGSRGKEGASRSPATSRWLLAASLGTLLTWNGAMLVRKIETFPFILPVLRADPIVDRARIARNVFDGLRSESLAEHTHLIFWSPEALALQRQAGRDTMVESYFERNVRSALYGGVGVRVMAPAVDSVEFVRAFHSADPSSRYALYRVDGRLVLFEPAVVESALSTGP